MAGPLERVRRLCLALPEAYEEETWGEATFRVRKKIFCMAGGHHPVGPPTSLSLKAEDQRALLAEGPPFFLPRYVGSKGWVGVDLAHPGLDWDEVNELIVDSYRLIAPRRLAARLPSD